MVVVVVVRGRSDEGGRCSVSGSEDSSQCRWWWAVVVVQ